MPAPENNNNTAMNTATITRIEDNQGIKTVHLEWSGPDDHTVEDFDLDQLGQRCTGIGRSTGGNLRGGWVILEGECQLHEGDTISLLATETETETA
jgi:hypothetical protein